MKSDTPKTDAAKWMKIGCVAGVDTNFAESLERENTALRELVDGASTSVELWNVQSPAQIRWKQDWLAKARAILGNPNKVI